MTNGAKITHFFKEKKLLFDLFFSDFPRKNDHIGLNIKKEKTRLKNCLYQKDLIVDFVQNGIKMVLKFTKLLCKLFT